MYLKEEIEIWEYEATCLGTTFTTKNVKNGSNGFKMLVTT